MPRKYKRVNHWEGALNRAINEARGKPFVFGENDCALMACTIVEAIVGVDFAASARGLYDEQPDEDLGDICTQFADKFGLPEVGVKTARRGDFVLLDHKRLGKALGVVDGTGMRAVFPKRGGGIERIAVIKCTRAWRV